MNILITGTSRGLGFALAKGLAKSHRVIGCARGDLLECYSGDHGFTHISGIDVAMTADLDKLDVYLEDMDVLINNVGVAYDGILATQSMESIRSIVDVNLISVIDLTRRYVRARLKKRKKGTVVSISSIIGIRGYAGLAAYSASKAGLDGMTRALARELGSKGFRFNSILPGYLETEMSKGLADAQRQQIIRRTPLGRLGRCEDIYPLVEFLVSEESTFITGQSIVVDGGITV